MKIKIVALVLFIVGSGVLLFSLNSRSSQLHAKSAVYASPDSINWKGMDHDAKLSYMKQVVMPKMRREFTAFDSVQFGNMKCGVCHGDGVKDGSFKMPNPKIFKLPNSREGWAKADPKFLKFMKEVVKPEMASLLGLQPYDMKTKTGFGCGNCHTDQE